MYKAVSFTETSKRRKGIEYVEKFKQTFDERHVLYGQEQQRKRLKSEKNFLQYAIFEPPDNYPINESPCTGSNLDWKIWRTLSRIRSGMAPVKANKFKTEENKQCLGECRERHGMNHLLGCTPCPATSSIDEMWIANNKAIHVARY
ncbi:hypothetical protein Trydic_g4541 [Trypoxylus dichotomus]